MQDAVELAQRLASLLESGRRVATYKLALLLALIDACAEVEQPQDEQPVSILELADRVIDLYWPQVRTYDERGQLRQSTQPRSRILLAVTSLHDLGPTGTAVRRLAPVAYERARIEVARTLADQPLPALQRPGSPFLYDDTWLYDGALGLRRADDLFGADDDGLLGSVRAGQDRSRVDADESSKGSSPGR